jgi:hypothetical protein
MFYCLPTILLFLYAPEQINKKRSLHTYVCSFFPFSKKKRSKEIYNVYSAFYFYLFVIEVEDVAAVRRL